MEGKRRTRRAVGAGRRGFTLTESLVVVAVIGVLVGLLLPAMLGARESMRRVECSHHLKQIGLALLQFDEVRRFWPPGGVDGTTPTDVHRALGIPPGVEHGWLPFLLPHLGETRLADIYRFDRDWRDPANRTARETFVATFQCPSTPQPSRWDQSSSGGLGSWRAAPTDYGAVNKIDSSLYRLGLIDYATSRHPTGMLRPNGLLTSAAMGDGASNQLVVAEDAGRPGHLLTGKRRRSGRITGAGWADRDNGFTVHGASFDGLSAPGPCPLNCTNANEIYSFHSGGAQTLFGDGSVRFLSEQVEMRVVATAISRAAGDLSEFP